MALHSTHQPIPVLPDPVSQLLSLFDALAPLSNVTSTAIFLADCPLAEHALRLWCSTRRDAFLSERAGDGMRWISACRSDDSEIVCVIEELT